MIDKKEMTAPNVSVGADTEQSIQKCTDNSITDYDENIKEQKAKMYIHMGKLYKQYLEQKKIQQRENSIK